MIPFEPSILLAGCFIQFPKSASVPPKTVFGASSNTLFHRTFHCPVPSTDKVQQEESRVHPVSCLLVRRAILGEKKRSARHASGRASAYDTGAQFVRLCCPSFLYLANVSSGPRSPGPALSVARCGKSDKRSDAPLRSKRGSFGNNNLSFSNNKTRRTFKPNSHRKTRRTFKPNAQRKWSRFRRKAPTPASHPGSFPFRQIPPHLFLKTCETFLCFTTKWSPKNNRGISSLSDKKYRNGPNCMILHRPASTGTIIKHRKTLGMNQRVTNHHPKACCYLILWLERQ